MQLLPYMLQTGILILLRYNVLLGKVRRFLDGVNGLPATAYGRDKYEYICDKQLGDEPLQPGASQRR